MTLYRQPLRRQRGMSLIELMVGMTLGLLLLTALVSLYSSTTQSRTQLNNSATQIENGRYALDIVGQEIGLAGFLGDLNLLGTSAISTPDVCASTPGFINSPATVPVAIYGYALNNTNPATCLPNRLPGSEILVVRRVSSTTVTPSTMAAGQAYVQDAFCTTDTAPFVFSSNAADFTLHDKSCGQPAQLRQVVVRAFYLATCDVCSGNGDGIPTLKMAEFLSGAMQQPPTSIAQGIQDVHFSYGVDVDNNGSPDCYVADPGIDNSAACSVGGYNWTTSAATNWSNVTAVRINVLARTLSAAPGWTDKRTYDLGRGTGSGSGSGPFNDGYKRHVYAEIARAANVAGPRE